MSQTRIRLCLLYCRQFIRRWSRCGLNRDWCSGEWNVVRHLLLWWLLLWLWFVWLVHRGCFLRCRLAWLRCRLTTLSRLTLSSLTLGRLALSRLTLVQLALNWLRCLPRLKWSNLRSWLPLYLEPRRRSLCLRLLSRNLFTLLFPSNISFRFLSHHLCFNILALLFVLNFFTLLLSFNLFTLLFPHWLLPHNLNPPNLNRLILHPGPPRTLRRHLRHNSHRIPLLPPIYLNHFLPLLLLLTQNLPNRPHRRSSPRHPSHHHPLRRRLLLLIHLGTDIPITPRPQKHKPFRLKRLFLPNITHGLGGPRRGDPSSITIQRSEMLGLRHGRLPPHF